MKTYQVIGELGELEYQGTSSTDAQDAAVRYIREYCEVDSTIDIRNDRGGHAFIVSSPDTMVTALICVYDTVITATRKAQ